MRVMCQKTFHNIAECFRLSPQSTIIETAFYMYWQLANPTGYVLRVNTCRMYEVACVHLINQRPPSYFLHPICPHVIAYNPSIQNVCARSWCRSSWLSSNCDRALRQLDKVTWTYAQGWKWPTCVWRLSIVTRAISRRWSPNSPPEICPPKIRRKNYGAPN